MPRFLGENWLEQVSCWESLFHFFAVNNRWIMTICAIWHIFGFIRTFFLYANCVDICFFLLLVGYTDRLGFYFSLIWFWVFGTWVLEFWIFLVWVVISKALVIQKSKTIMCVLEFSALNFNVLDFRTFSVLEFLRFGIFCFEFLGFGFLDLFCVGVFAF